MRGRRALLALTAAMPLPLAAQELTQAQILLFETPHLAALQPPLRLDYDFRREADAAPPVQDSIRLAVTEGAEPGRRDVVPEFLTGPRAIRFPSAQGFRGNPLLLYALDRAQRELAAATGGAPDWFRNRIRRALAESASTRAVTLPFDAANVPATEIVFTPFVGEPRARRYQDCRFRFVLAEAVPGWIADFATDLPAGEGGGAVRESIRFAAAVPL